ncbi:Cat eye syndrome critical region protein 2 homolog [Geodia barretti]|uniref:Cat eye syndrome critical region protein 2 homolog n=1 Tax=Geodia barretti TaxID=519541 RepID=A0AA35SQJ5_GEOBA|nr:Cat eye syndrome critical region protein 2 homolog [Geodia barretti]
MEEIRSWWEVPCVSHFCKIFSKPFKLPEFEIEELEDALLLDMNPDPSSLLVQLFVIFLNGIVDRDITEENWQSFLKLHVRWRCDFLHEKWDPFQSKGCDYGSLGAREKVELLHKLCHWRLELDDVGDLVRGYDGPSLRLLPLGRDGDGFLYWFFYGTRLYREAPSRRAVRKKKTDDHSETGRGRGKATPSGRKKAVPTPQRKGAGSRAGRGQSTRRTPSTRGKGRRAAAKEESSDGEESQIEGQSCRRPQNRRNVPRCEQLAGGDDEGYEGSGEEGGGKRGRKRARGAAPAESPGENECKDDLSGNKTPSAAPVTSPVKENEEKMETEAKEGEGEGEGEGGERERERGREMKKWRFLNQFLLQTQTTTVTSEVEMRREEVGEKVRRGTEGGVSELATEVVERCVISFLMTEQEKEPSPAECVGEGVESEEKGEEEESEDDAIDWQPASGRGRGRGKSQSVRGRRRKAEASEAESEEEVEEEEKEGKEEKDTGEKKREKWQIVCSTEEEWDELVASLSTVRAPSVKKLYRALEELLPDVQYLFREREKELKRKMIAELPRRTSDRIALKAQREEEERLDAQLRERQREVLRKEREEEKRRKEDEAEEKRQKRRDEAILRRKAREEEQMKVREEEEKNWQQAMSGELSGPRKAALGAAEGVSEVIKAVEGEGGLDDLAMEGDKEEFLYTAFYKILSGLRRQEDSWVFEDPVTESIAPGYHEQISMPMDYSTFETDVKLIFNNCIEYNGEDSEYSELANQMLVEFQKLCKVHLDGGGVKAELEIKTKGSRSSRSPSVCKTPELTSESSSEEASDEDSDDSYSEGTGKPKKKASGTGGLKPLLLTPKLSQQLPHSTAHLPPRPPHPYYHHQMMMQYRMRFDGAPPPHMAPPPPEMMFRPPAYGRPPPPYSQHPHMPRPPDHHFPTYPPNYPPHFPPSPYHHLHGFRHGFPPHMLSPQQRPHLSPTAAHGRPGSVPPGPNSVPHSSTSTPPHVSDPGSIPHSSDPGSIPESNMQEGVPGKVVGDEEGKGGREEKEQEEGKKVEDEQGREEKKEGGEAKDGDKKRAEGQEEGTQTSDGRETVAENGASPPIMVQSGPPPPPPHGPPHQMSKQQQAAYRYHQHMMRAAGGGASHTHPDFYQRYPHGYNPHYLPQNLLICNSDSRQCMVARGRPGVSPDDMQRHQQQMYWMEMERRRQYYMYMQQRAKAAQMGQSQKPVATSNKQESNELPGKEGGVESSNKSKEEEEEKMEQKASTKQEGAKDENRASAHEESETDGGEKERGCPTPDTKTTVSNEDKMVPAPSQDEKTLAPSKEKVTAPPEDKKTPGAEDREAGVGEERNTPRAAKDGKKDIGSRRW